MHVDAETGSAHGPDVARQRVARDLARLVAACVDHHDGVSQRHSLRVAWIARAIAEAAGADASVAFYGGLLHDVGALELEDGVVRHARLGFSHAPAREHPLRGAALIRPLASLEGLCDAIAAHHERLDGSGFPRGLAHDDLPLDAALLGLADELELTLRRVPAGEREAALEAHALLVRGIRFPAALVDAALASASIWCERAFDPIALAPALDALTLPLPGSERHDARLVALELTWLVSHVVDVKLGRAGGAIVREAVLAHRIARRLADDPWGATAVALLHDLGALALPRILVEARGVLGAADRALYERHAGVTAEMLEALPALAHLAHAAGSVHETFHGRGFPRGLAGAEIPRAARVVAYASAFERVYGVVEGISVEEAIDVVRMQVGSTLDPALADPSLEVLAESADVYAGPIDVMRLRDLLELPTSRPSSARPGSVPAGRHALLELERDLARREEDVRRLEAELAERDLRIEAQAAELEAARAATEALEQALADRARALDDALAQLASARATTGAAPHDPGEHGGSALPSRSAVPPRAETPLADVSQLFDRGLDLAREGDWAAALAVWERARELEPHNRMLLANLEIARRKASAT